MSEAVYHSDPIAFGPAPFTSDVVTFARGAAKASAPAAKPKAGARGKLHGAGNCGTGRGGFKPGNVCGKGSRGKLAADIATARAGAHDPASRAALRAKVRELKAHRRDHAGSVPDATAKGHRDALRAIGAGKASVARTPARAAASPPPPPAQAAPPPKARTPRAPKAAAQAPPSPPTSGVTPHRAPAARTPARRAESAILRAYRDLEPHHADATGLGLVPIHAVRVAVEHRHPGAFAREHFDAAVKALRGRRKLRAVEISDTRDLGGEQLSNSVATGLGDFAYLKRGRATPRRDERLVAAPGRPLHTPEEGFAARRRLAGQIGSGPKYSRTGPEARADAFAQIDRDEAAHRAAARRPAPRGGDERRDRMAEALRSFRRVKDPEFRAQALGRMRPAAKALRPGAAPAPPATPEGLAPPPAPKPPVPRPPAVPPRAHAPGRGTAERAAAARELAAGRGRGRQRPEIASKPEHERAVLKAFEKLDAADRGRNSVRIEQLRAELPHLSRSQADAAINALRDRDVLTLDSHEGIHGPLTRQQMRAAIKEGRHHGRKVIFPYVSRRDR